MVRNISFETSTKLYSLQMTKLFRLSRYHYRVEFICLAERMSEIAVYRTSRSIAPDLHGNIVGASSTPCTH